MYGVVKPARLIRDTGGETGSRQKPIHALLLFDDLDQQCRGEVPLWTFIIQLFQMRCGYM